MIEGWRINIFKKIIGTLADFYQGSADFEGNLVELH